MRIRQLFLDLQRVNSKKEKVVRDDRDKDERRPKTPKTPKTPNMPSQKVLLRPTSIKNMPSFVKAPYESFKRHTSASSIKIGQHKKLSSVSEEEEIAFNYQMALLEEPPEWDLDDAGIGSKAYESPSLTPPAVTPSRTGSPSHMEKIAETSKKKLKELASRLNHSHEDLRKEAEDERLSKSLPDLSKLSGKGHAGNKSKIDDEISRGRSLSVDEDALTRTRSKSGPPSWRLPPQNIAKRMPHVREAVPPPSFPLGAVDVKQRPSAVQAHAMWKNGEVRYEDQWGHRLVPVGRHNSFMFELWPVSETTEDETPLEKIEFFHD